MGLGHVGAAALETLSLTLPSDVREALDVPVDPDARRRELDAVEQAMVHCSVPEVERILSLSVWEDLTDRQFKIAAYVFWQGRAAKTSLV